MEKKPSEILQEALDSFGPNGENWIKGWYMQYKYVDDFGNVHTSVSKPKNKKPIKDYCFCSLGAISSATHPDFKKTGSYRSIWGQDALYYLEKQIFPFDSVHMWNDDANTKFSDVKEAFEKAIEHAKKHGK